MDLKQKLFVLFLCTLSLSAFSQEGTLRGDFMMNSAFYIDDPRLGQYGTNTTQYKNEKSSAEAWMFLNYNVKGYDFNIRYDLFHNSPLLNPQEAYSAQGLPFFNVNKTFDNLTITVGSFYDQFGSGALFRAYENRIIGIDFAMQGVKLEYNYKDKLTFKAFSGKQKNRFDAYPQAVQGLNVEGGSFGKVSLTYGASVVKRTLSFAQDIQGQLVPAINALPLADRFIPNCNVYGGQLYGSVTMGNLTLNGDVAMKSREAVYDFNQNLINKEGLYATAGASYSAKGFGISVQGKFSDHFAMRTTPGTQLSPILTGSVSFLAPLNRQNTYRLPARYSPAVQEIGEQGFQADVNYAVNRKNVFNINYSYIIAPDIIDETLFREFFFTYQKKFTTKFKGVFGYQNILYNQKIYEGKSASVPNVSTHTPFMELTWKLKNKKSVRFEAHYLRTDEDLGDFAFGLIEFNIAPKYTFSISDMVNTQPAEATRNVNVAEGELVHYPTFFFAYSHNQTRLTAGYIKQVEGVVCTGGVCRLEPAFSGVRIGLTTNF